MRSLPSSRVMSTPVRMARLSSFDTTRATRRTIDENSAKGTSMRWSGVTSGKAGKSCALSTLSENDAVSQVIWAWSSSPLKCTAASGKLRTMSANSLPGTTVEPGSSMRAAQEYLIESSRSVVCSTRRSPSAVSKMPERTGNVERLDMPFSTMERALDNSPWLMLNFMGSLPLPAGGVVSLWLRALYKACAQPG